MSLPMADKGPVSGVSRPILTVPSAMAFVAPPAITPATSKVSRTPTHALVLIVPSLVIPSFDLSSGGPVASHDVAAQIGRGGENDSRAPLPPGAEASALRQGRRRVGEVFVQGPEGTTARYPRGDQWRARRLLRPCSRRPARASASSASAIAPSTPARSPSAAGTT